MAIDSFEGFGGPARIVEVRRSPTSKYRVEMLNGSQPYPFWAHDFEVAVLAIATQEFDRAWLHHQHANDHHWQHWCLREDSGALKLLPIPEHVSREMVADWMGAGRAITGRWEVAEWYAKNRDVILLHETSRPFVEKLIHELTHDK